MTGAIIGLWLLKVVFDYLAELQDLNDHYNYLDALRFIAYSAPVIYSTICHLAHY